MFVQVICAEMDPATLARGLGAGRAALGVALLVTPTLPTRVWVGRDAKRPAARLTTMALGAREVAIGLGTAQAVARGADARSWLQAGAFCDAVDAAMTVATRAEIPTSGAVIVTAMATSAATLGAWLAAKV